MQVHIRDEDGDVLLPWTQLGSGNKHFTSVTGLSMRDGHTYQMRMRATGISGLTSHPITANVTIETQAPEAGYY